MLYREIKVSVEGIKKSMLNRTLYVPIGTRLHELCIAILTAFRADISHEFMIKDGISTYVTLSKLEELEDKGIDTANVEFLNVFCVDELLSIAHLFYGEGDNLYIFKIEINKEMLQSDDYINIRFSKGKGLGIFEDNKKLLIDLIDKKIDGNIAINNKEGITFPRNLNIRTLSEFFFPLDEDDENIYLERNVNRNIYKHLDDENYELDSVKIS